EPVAVVLVGPDAGSVPANCNRDHARVDVFVPLAWRPTLMPIVRRRGRASSGRLHSPGGVALRLTGGRGHAINVPDRFRQIMNSVESLLGDVNRRIVPDVFRLT